MLHPPITLCVLCPWSISLWWRWCLWLSFITIGWQRNVSLATALDLPHSLGNISLVSSVGAGEIY